MSESQPTSSTSSPPAGSPYHLITELRPDQDNANEHTEYGMGLLENAIQSHGLGRGVLVDKNLNIIAGNGTVEAALNAGLQRAILVPLTGNELLVGVRTDVELDTPRGRALALADNGIHGANCKLNPEKVIRQAKDYDLNLEQVGISPRRLKQIVKQATEEADRLGGMDQSIGGGEDASQESRRFALAVFCEDEPDRQHTLGQLRELGLDCRLM